MDGNGRTARMITTYLLRRGSPFYVIGALVR
nr:hypothetical protein [Paenibacillus popilliae]